MFLNNVDKLLATLLSAWHWKSQVPIRSARRHLRSLPDRDAALIKYIVQASPAKQRDWGWSVRAEDEPDFEWQLIPLLTGSSLVRMIFFDFLCWGIYHIYHRSQQSAWYGCAAACRVVVEKAENYPTGFREGNMEHESRDSM
jgi:hypothetical protein